MTDRMVQVVCPLKNECKVPVCHHKIPHEFNKDTCNLTAKLKNGCNPSMTCVHISQMITPCDDCVKFECEYRGRVESIWKDSHIVESHYHNCGYVTKDTLKLRPVICEDCPDCFGLLYCLDNSECKNCLINEKCLDKYFEYVDKGVFALYDV